MILETAAGMYREAHEPRENKIPRRDSSAAKSFTHWVSAADWKNAGVFTKSRGVLLDNLTPGTTYDVQARAVGGATGYSDWSDPVSHMAT